MNTLIIISIVALYVLVIALCIRESYKAEKATPAELDPDWATNTWIIRKDNILRQYNIPDLSRRKRNERRSD